MNKYSNLASIEFKRQSAGYVISAYGTTNKGLYLIDTILCYSANTAKNIINSIIEERG